MGLIERLTADAACLRGALRTLKMTTPIAAEPDARLPAGDRRARRQVRRRARRCSPTASASAIASSPSAPTATRAGRSRRASRKGDTVCLLMPNRPEFMAIWLGITRRRRRGGAAQHQSDRTGARALHQRRRTRGTSIVAAELLDRVRQRARRTSPATPKIWLHGEADANFRASTARSSDYPGDAARRRRAPAAHHRGSRALHLHVRHHRPAQGRQRQPLPA